MVNVSDGAKEKLLEYLKNNKSDLAVRVVLSHG
jgi:Fe-S cluster assembly iron-binding protein IscA